MNNKISICIPAYKRTAYLKRLLESILIQTYKNYEVIISDDSDDNSVYDLAKHYDDLFTIKYYKNATPLGSPGNWLNGIEKATGDWIKLIHDDDWLCDADSLNQFHLAIKEDDTRLIFSGYNAYYEATETYVNETITPSKFDSIQKSPQLLFAKNVIGPPSVLMCHKSIAESYDVNLKWFVDIEYYLRVMSREKAVYIDKPLINVSYNDTQITNYTRTNPAVVVPESLYIINKHGKKVAGKLWSYDSWWRVFRNLDVKNVAEIKKFAPNSPIPLFIKKMLAHQQMVPAKMLRKGPVSKIAMTLSYFFNYGALDKK